MMTDILLCLPAAALCGLGRRVAGGAFQQWTGIDVGDLPARLFFAGTLTAAAALGGAFARDVPIGGWVFPAWCQVLAMIVGAWVGTTIPMGGIDLGKNSGQVLESLCGLALHGSVGGGLLALLAYAAAAWWPALFVAGLLMPAFYWLGWTIAGERGAQWLPLGLRGGSEIGEATWGAAMGVAAVWAFV